MKGPQPPKWAIRFLEWFCPPALYECIIGDLTEQFDHDVRTGEHASARRNFIKSALRFFRPGIFLRNRFSLHLINTIMLASYFKITWRNMLKNKGYSFINIFGLSMGIACCLLMFNYVTFELSYDNFHPAVDHTYRVDQVAPDRQGGGASSSTAPPLANAMKTTYPEVEEVMRINTPGDFLVRYEGGGNGTMAFNENKVYAADPTFFSFFGFKLKEGNPKTALEGLDKVVISAETAEKLFGNKPALGKILLFGEGRIATEVTGVTEHQPPNAHFHFDYLLSMDSNPEVKKRDWSWVWTHMVTYIRLRPGVDPSGLEHKMARLADDVIKPAFERRGMDYDGALMKGGWTFIMRPLRDIHLRSGDNRIGPVGSIQYTWTFGVIGAFVLVIAAINFINLSTARGTKRAKEVGVKKTLGARRSSLVWQFQTESMLLTIFSMALALLLVEAVRTAISVAIGIEIPFALWQKPEMWLLIPVIPLVIGFMAGLYPSFYLTVFKPALVLKGKTAMGLGRSGLRNALVVVQFTVSIGLIAGTAIVFQQLGYIRSSNLGFEKENILLVRYAEKLGTHLESFRNDVETFPGVVDAGIAMEAPGGGVWDDGFTSKTSGITSQVAIVKVDEHYFNSLGFKLAAGRAFEKERPSDKNAVILNETTAQLFGWNPEQALGQYLVYPGNDNTRHEVIGVMKDFHYQSFRENITPLMFCKVDAGIWGDWRVLTVKFRTTDIPGLIAHIEGHWHKVLNDTPMSFSFLDQDLASQYQSEQQLGGLFGFFSGLSILIAVIGLVGLVSYSAEVRRKEIGIRKVFGASTGNILLMMNSEYAKLIMISFLIAIPLSWWALSQWLDTFVFRINISPLTFLLAGLVQLGLALSSVAYLSFRAAALNPSRALKEE